MTLQLGCVGSKTRVGYGANTTATINNREFDCYLDITNLDHYDVILGTPFLSEYGGILDFKNRTITIDGTTVNALTVQEERDRIRTRRVWPRPDKGNTALNAVRVEGDKSD